MKKLLFLIVCVLLPICATAAPASAGVTYYYVDTNSGSACASDETNHVPWAVRTVPAYFNVRIGLSLALVKRGLSDSFGNALLTRLQVTDRYGNWFAGCDESSCRSYRSEPYHLNDWISNPADWFYPPNPAVIAAGNYGVDWLFPLPARKLAPGRYAFSMANTLTRAIADPMWEITPGTGTPIHEGWPWTEYDWLTFRVK